MVTLTILIAILIVCGNRGTRDNVKYTVDISESNGLQNCQITFSGELPPPAAVDKIVRDVIEDAARKDPSKDILATAFLGNEVLDDNQYSGELVYKAAEKKILTFNEYRGVKTSTSSTSSYFVEIEEDHTYEGITPPKKWLDLTIVFPKTPSREVAYGAILTEIQKVINRRLDVNAFVSVGDKNVKTSWHQMRDSDGAYVFAEYESATKSVTRKGKLLKKLS
jgi:hypothetical protein